MPAQACDHQGLCGIRFDAVKCRDEHSCDNIVSVAQDQVVRGAMNACCQLHFDQLKSRFRQPAGTLERPLEDDNDQSAFIQVRRCRKYLLSTYMIEIVLVIVLVLLLRLSSTSICPQS